MPYIYIIHFDEALKHAQHYVGVCADHRLRARLHCHATGHGANLLKVLQTLGINWKLGGLIKTTGHPRIDEDRVKRMKNTKRYCEFCTPNPIRLSGTVPMQIELVKFKTDSISLKENI